MAEVSLDHAATGGISFTIISNQTKNVVLLENDQSIAGNKTFSGQTTFFDAVDINANLNVNDKFTVASGSGNTSITGDLAVNTNKFTVAASSGNTVIAGTTTLVVHLM